MMNMTETGRTGLQVGRSVSPMVAATEATAANVVARRQASVCEKNPPFEMPVAKTRSGSTA